MLVRNAAGKKLIFPFHASIEGSQNRPTRSGLAPTARLNLRRASTHFPLKSQTKPFARLQDLADHSHKLAMLPHPLDIWYSLQQSRLRTGRHSLCYEDPLCRGLQGKRR